MQYIKSILTLTLLGTKVAPFMEKFIFDHEWGYNEPTKGWEGSFGHPDGEFRVLCHSSG
jgi:hypothetical protein